MPDPYGLLDRIPPMEYVEAMGWFEPGMPFERSDSWGFTHKWVDDGRGGFRPLRCGGPGGSGGRRHDGGQGGGGRPGGGHGGGRSGGPPVAMEDTKAMEDTGTKTEMVTRMQDMSIRMVIPTVDEEQLRDGGDLVGIEAVGMAALFRATRVATMVPMKKAVRAAMGDRASAA